MKHPSLQRYYPVPVLNFRDFWDIVSHFQRVNPRYTMITYTVEGSHGVLVQDEVEVSLVLRALSSARDSVRSYTARLWTDDDSDDNTFGSAKLLYFPALTDFQEAGLYYYGPQESKLSLYHFENLLYSNYALKDPSEEEPEFGQPCEVLASVVDLRGFSKFCEQPHIESPYTCGLMTAFYNVVKACFIKYPPDMMKFLGDGVLSVWQTGNEDREVAIDIAISGLDDITPRWRKVLSGPQFIHGAPEGVGSGLSFGLASRISMADDYLGRPVNLASRLASVCPPGVVLIDRNLPNVRDRAATRSRTTELKSFGEYKVWALE